MHNMRGVQPVPDVRYVPVPTTASLIGYPRLEMQLPFGNARTVVRPHGMAGRPCPAIPDRDRRPRFTLLRLETRYLSIV